MDTTDRSTASAARPPSVDALARSLRTVDLPHAIRVDIAREAIPAGDPGSALMRAERFRQTLLTPVVNATGVLLHTNLGRAPVAVDQPDRAINVEFDLSSGERGSRQAAVGDLLARLCGAEAAMVVNNNTAAVMLVLAALAFDRGVAVSRGESVEIGGAFRVPDVMEQSGATLVDVGTTNRTRLADYAKAVARPGNDIALTMKVHPSNFRIEGFVEDTSIAELATLDVPVVADIGSGLIDVNCPWLGGAPPAWLAGEPAARQALHDGAALVTFSGDKLFGGPQAGIIAGRRDFVERCERHPLARALRPGGLVLATLQQTALSYLDRSAATDVPFWRMVATPLDELRRRADRVCSVAATGSVETMDALPGAGSAPGAVIASIGVMVDGDHLAALRANAVPIIGRVRDGRTLLDLRSVNPADDDVIIDALAGIAPQRLTMHVVATAGHVDHGKSTLVLALTGTDPDRFEEEKRRGLTIDLGFAHTTLPSGAGISFIDVPGHVRFLRNMLAGVGGVDACLFVVAATEGWKPQSEEHLRILELLGVRHGVIALTKVDLVDDEWREIATLDVIDRVAGTFLADAPIVPVAATAGLGMDDLRAALDALLAATPQSDDRGRPRLWVDRVFAAKGSGTVVTGTLTGGVLSTDDHVVVGDRRRDARVRAIQSHGATVSSIGPGNRVALNLSGVEHTDVQRGDAIVRREQWLPTRRLDASLAVLARLDHDVSRRGAYAAYIGSGEHAAKVRVLGIEAIAPGTAGAIRLHLPVELPLLPGDRFILRESGRNETVGGGEVLDIHPVLPASKARPDRTVERVVRERGWVTCAQLQLLTGQQHTPVIGAWVVTPEALTRTTDGVRRKVSEAGPLGLDVAVLDERERAVLATLDGIEIDQGMARPAAQHDPLLDHPFVAALAAGGFAPPDATGVDRTEMRQLIRRNLVVERDGVHFHPQAIGDAARIAAQLLAADPDGFTVAQFRDAVGVTRKHALPLLAELDGRGVTRRRDDLRIGGPRLPVVGA